MSVRVPASTEYDHYEVPLGPNGQLFIATSYGHAVYVDGIAWVGPTPGGTGSDVAMDPFGGGNVVGADRPGPFNKPAGKSPVHAVVRAKSDHAFTLYSR